MTKYPHRHNKHWSAHEDSCLVRLFERKYPSILISDYLARTRAAVRQRKYIMKLKFRGGYNFPEAVIEGASEIPPYRGE